MPFPMRGTTPYDPKSGTENPGTFDDPRVMELLKQIMQISPQAFNNLGSRFNAQDSPLHYPDIGFMSKNSPPISASIMDTIAGNLKPSVITRLKAARKARQAAGAAGQTAAALGGGMLSLTPKMSNVWDDLWTKSQNYGNSY